MKYFIIIDIAFSEREALFNLLFSPRLYKKLSLLIIKLAYDIHCETS